jgi:hypothetical protein
MPGARIRVVLVWASHVVHSSRQHLRRARMHENRQVLFLRLGQSRGAFIHGRDRCAESHEFEEVLFLFGQSRWCIHPGQ